MSLSTVRLTAQPEHALVVLETNKGSLKLCTVHTVWKLVWDRAPYNSARLVRTLLWFKDKSLVFR